MEKIPSSTPPARTRADTPTPTRAIRPNHLNIRAIENRLGGTRIRIEPQAPTRCIHETIAGFRAASPPQPEPYRPVTMRLDELAKVYPELAARAPLPASRLSGLLLAGIALNSEHTLVSEASESLLLEALNTVRGSEVRLWRSGERPYEVLSVFVTRLRELRPHLF